MKFTPLAAVLGLVLIPVILCVCSYISYYNLGATNDEGLDVELYLR